MADNEELLAKEQQPVSIFIADGNMQAEMIISTLKAKGIMASTGFRRRRLCVGTLWYGQRY